MFIFFPSLLLLVSDCGDPAPLYGYATITTGTLYEDVATVYCNSGYNLTGSSTIICTSSGEWNESTSCNIQSKKIRDILFAKSRL